jgi:hypothetical protein
MDRYEWVGGGLGVWAKVGLRRDSSERSGVGPGRRVKVRLASVCARRLSYGVTVSRCPVCAVWPSSIIGAAVLYWSSEMLS